MSREPAIAGCSFAAFRKYQFEGESRMSKHVLRKPRIARFFGSAYSVRLARSDIMERFRRIVVSELPDRDVLLP